MILTDRLDRAIKTAAWHHRRQSRKNTIPYPYIVHPFAVCVILSRHTDDEDILIAGLLHDTIEDTEYTTERIQTEFGDHVARIVLDVTEPPKASVGSWKEQKMKYIEHLKTASQEALMVASADKIHNMRSSMGRSDVPADVPSDEQKLPVFHSNAQDRLQVCEQVFAVVSERLKEHPIVEEYEKVLDEHRDFVNNSER